MDRIFRMNNNFERHRFMLKRFRVDSVGQFHLEQMDGKLYFIYHPKQSIKSPTSSVEATSDDRPLKPLFLCPVVRKERDMRADWWFKSSPEYDLSTKEDDDHHVFPLFWCNNKEFDVNGGCDFCQGSNFGTDYYFCEFHHERYHKECVESPLNIEHPYHPEHSLGLYNHFSNYSHIECFCCGKNAKNMVYQCDGCEVYMHTICAMKSIPFVIDQPKRHDHSLTLFPRQTSLTCNVCGLLRKFHPTFVCLICNFVSHRDCMYFPSIIKISRHHHRISYVPSLRRDTARHPPSVPYISIGGKWCCGVCRKDIDDYYGAYTCETCSSYFVHSRCALGKEVCDGKELEGVPEEGDITQDDGSFDIISKGVILHFLHDHHLLLEVSILYDENKLCQACVLPVYEGNLYSCKECDFIIHETCASAPRRIQHALHPHPLTLKDLREDTINCFECDACGRYCGGFVYQCPIKECNYDLDLRCASISEPYSYTGHEHPLFLALDPMENPNCHVCNKVCYKQLNCIICDFIVCIKCVTLPNKARYKHDAHLLTVLCGGDVREKSWCEVCECNLKDTRTEVFYSCNECCTTLHIECLVGEDPYLKPGQIMKGDDYEFQILGKSNTSRPLCGNCKKPCQGKILKTDDLIACSVNCLVEILMSTL